MLALANCNVSQTSFPTDKYRCIGSVYIYICQKRWQMERTEAWSKGQILAHPPKKLKKTLTHTSIGVRICIGLFCFAAFLVFGTS